MSDRPYFIDVNVPMYAAGREHANKAGCVWVMTEIAQGNLPAVIDAEIVQEIMYRYGALHEWQLAVDMATTVIELIPDIMPVTQKDMEIALDLFGRYGPQGVVARDVVHAAVMIHNGLTQIVSTDRHYDLLPGIVRLDPNDLLAASTS